MSDDPNPHSTDGQDPLSPESGELGAYNEQELDEMLLRASSLASELAESDGVAEPAAQSEPTPVSEVVEQATNVVDSLDSQLAGLDEMLETAQQELGAAADVGADDTDESGDERTDAEDEHDDAPADDADDAAVEAQADVSDDLDAATDDEDDQPGETESHGIEFSEGDLDAADEIPDFGDGTEPDELPPAPTARTQPAAVAPAAPAPGGAVPAGASGKARFGLAVAVPAWLAPMRPLALRVAQLGVVALEMTDRPFGRIPLNVKHILGYAALATLGTSMIVLLMSLF